MMKKNLECLLLVFIFTSEEKFIRKIINNNYKQ